MPLFLEDAFHLSVVSVSHANQSWPCHISILYKIVERFLVFDALHHNVDAHTDREVIRLAQVDEEVQAHDAEEDLQHHR